MKLLQIRFKSNDNASVSKLYVDKEFECYIVEDEHRNVKVKHETRIPAGIYELIIRKFGGFHEKFSKKFSEWHKGMIEIKNVPGFTDILIHPGNSEKDTSGCLLPGGEIDLDTLTVKPGTSTPAYKKLYLKIIPLLENKEKVFIEIVDHDFENTEITVDFIEKYFSFKKANNENNN